MPDDSKKPGENERAESATLTIEDIVVERDVGRRSVLTAIGASVLGAVATACGPRYPRPRYGYARTGFNDNDPQDPAGGGRGVAYVQPQPQTVYVQPQQQPVYVQQPATGVTDHDNGPYADPAGRGRGAAPMRTGLTDGDSGPYADPAGGGRGTYRSGWSTGATDGDTGAYADPAGRGRGRSGLTDSDSGPYADPPGRGRGGIRAGGGYRTGVTDSDSSDPAGGGRNTGVNDSDPSDPAGRGRFGR